METELHKDEMRERIMIALRDHMDECSSCHELASKMLAHWSTFHRNEATKLLQDDGVLGKGKTL